MGKRAWFSLALILLLVLVVGGTGLAVTIDEDTPVTPEEELYRARVLTVTDLGDAEELVGFHGARLELVQVEILAGPWRGEIVEIEHIRGGNLYYDILPEAGREVMVMVSSQDGRLQEAFIAEYARDKQLLYLFLLFAGVLVVVGGLRGIKALITLGLTVAVIMYVLLPLLLQGYQPILLATLIAGVTAALTLAIIGGLRRKTGAAILGTTGGVICAGALAYIFGNAAALTGLSGEEAQMLQFIPQEIEFDYRGLLFAGMLIGAMGAVMDVAMSIASSLAEIRKANPELRFPQLFGAGMNVGRDIMGTMTNTLVLAYTGSAIPMLLLFMAYDISLSKIVNLDFVATEVVRALAGSTGLLLAIPLTALAAAFLEGRR